MDVIEATHGRRSIRAYRPEPVGNNEAAFDCCRAAQNLMLAAHARGLGSCWLGAPLPWLTSPGIANELGVPADFHPIVALVLGYPADAPAGSPRIRPVVHWFNSSTLRPELTAGHLDH